MLFSWLRNRRRRQLLAEPFPIRWSAIVDRNVGHAALLSPSERQRLNDLTRILLAEKRWHGRGGLFISEEMRVTIAAQAALPLLGADRGYYKRVRDVFVFPTEFRTPVAEDDWEDDELSEIPLAGQAWERGQVILAWDQVLAEGRNPQAGFNVVMHEFAHQLDFMDRLALGVPDLGNPALESRWNYVMAVTFEDHRRAVRARSPNTVFTPHAADSEAEFFADATEAFFCRSVQLQHAHPEVYDLLKAYYRSDPVAWFRRSTPDAAEPRRE